MFSHHSDQMSQRSHICVWDLSVCSEIKMSVTVSVTQWQGRILSCPQTVSGQQKYITRNYIDFVMIDLHSAMLIQMVPWEGTWEVFWFRVSFSLWRWIPWKLTNFAENFPKLAPHTYICQLLSFGSAGNIWLNFELWNYPSFCLIFVWNFSYRKKIIEVALKEINGVVLLIIS